jgi:hypothetical protein
MKKLRKISMLLLFAFSIATIVSCKKNTDENAVDNTQMTDTTAVDSTSEVPTGPVIDSPVSGVESGVGDEQVP